MWLVALYGTAIGAVLGLTGAGGGILAVPALVLGLHWTMPDAAPVALLAVGLAASLGAADGLRQGLVRWRAALLMAVLGVSISPLGVRAAHWLPTRVLTVLFAVAMLASSARLIFSAQGGGGAGTMTARKNCMLDEKTGRLHWTVRCATTLGGIGAFSGLLTGLLGVGGGFLLVPAFRQWSDIQMKGIVATSLMVVALISLGAAAGAMASGAAVTSEGYGFVAASIFGMVLGRSGARFFTGGTMQLGFAILSAAVAVFMVTRTLFA